MVNPNRFYTYAYLREDRTPYYVGKGAGNRVYDKRRKTKPPKDKSRIIFLKQNLTEEEAFKHELYMIAVFGRKDLGTGILHNRTNGGEGSSGAVISEKTRKKMSEAGKNKILSEEHRRKISEANKRRIVSKETRKKMSEWVRSEETKKKMSEAGKNKILSEEHRRKLTGKTHSEDTRKKMSKYAKNRSDEHRKKLRESSKGKKWWNDGCGNTKFAVECPGNNWYQGRGKIKTKHYEYKI